MKQRVKYCLSTLWCLLTVVVVSAQRIEVVVPSVVAVGENFRLEYRSTQAIREFSEPSFADIEVIAGPTSAKYTSTRVVNGSMVQETTYAYTYILCCGSAREYTVGEASGEIDGKRVTAGGFTISAINETSTQQQSNGGGSGSSQTPRLADDDVIIRLIVDKNSLYKGEALRVTFKLYTRADIRFEGAKIPAFNGFWSQQLDASTQQQRETLNGKIYTSQILRDYLLFPQQSGRLTIEPLTTDVVARFVVRRPSTGNILEDMMSGGGEVKEIRRKIASQQVVINVNPLPSGAPESFSGAVGEFTMKVEPIAEMVSANSAITLTVKVEGNGNLPQVQAPRIRFPESFEQYTVKTTESVTNTVYGVRGLRQFEYPMIARAEGEYHPGAVEFTYFSPRQSRYITITSRLPNLTVTPDTTSSSVSGAIVGGLSKEDIRMLGSDIRFIRLGSGGLHYKRQVLLGSGFYLLALLAIIGIGVVLYFCLRSTLNGWRNDEQLRGRYANRIALQRLRSAEKYMNETNRRGFYEEMLRGLWGYMADKLNIPVSNLTKESIREKLSRRGVQGELAESYIAIIGECEYAQYSPAVIGEMDEAYGRGVDSITRMEDILN